MSYLTQPLPRSTELLVYELKIRETERLLSLCVGSTFENCMNCKVRKLRCDLRSKKKIKINGVIAKVNMTAHYLSFWDNFV